MICVASKCRTRAKSDAIPFCASHWLGVPERLRRDVMQSKPEAIRLARVAAEEATRRMDREERIDS